MATACPVEDVTAHQLQPGIATIDENRGPYTTLRDSHEQLSIRELPVTPLFGPDQPVNPRPEFLRFAAIHDPLLRVVQAVPLQISVENEIIIACWAETGEYGTGATLSEALDDFERGVRELCQQLFLKHAKLGADLQNVKSILERHIQPR